MSFRDPDTDKLIIIESQKRICSLMQKHNLERSQVKFLLISYTLTEIEHGHWEGSIFRPAENLLSPHYLKFKN